ncbi:MAG TPA: hypothetical protein VM554_15050 [Acidisarcina sp.]|nr:hypothetical protein [Acidisarcina sp.]
MLALVFPIRFTLSPWPCRVSPARATILACLLSLTIAGCSKTGGHVSVPSLTQPESPEAVQARAARDTARQELDQIPPPSKSLYLAVRSQEGWTNPFLTVDKDILTLRIILPDANPSPMGQGGLLRPSSARKQTVQIRLTELPKALTALPPEAWPYGRVIAVAEAPTTDKAVRPEIRRKMEATIQVLNDLGIVVDEWSGPGGGFLR